VVVWAQSGLAANAPTMVRHTSTVKPFMKASGGLVGLWVG
jgi:hypothetical protein